MRHHRSLMRGVHFHRRDDLKLYRRPLILGLCVYICPFVYVCLFVSLLLYVNLQSLYRCCSHTCVAVLRISRSKCVYAYVCLLISLSLSPPLNVCVYGCLSVIQLFSFFPFDAYLAGNLSNWPHAVWQAVKAHLSLEPHFPHLSLHSWN